MRRNLIDVLFFLHYGFDRTPELSRIFHVFVVVVFSSVLIVFSLWTALFVLFQTLLVFSSFFNIINS